MQTTPDSKPAQPAGADPLPVLNLIAQVYLRIPTLTQRWSDSWDFHEVAVWTLQAALQAAFNAGQQSVINPQNGLHLLCAELSTQLAERQAAANNTYLRD